MLKDAGVAKMKIFLSGATGVLGRRVVRLLVEQGHHVIGLSRSQRNEEWISQNGAEARLGDLFNLSGMIRLTGDCEAILHLATAIPKKARTSLADWAANDRIRREGTEILVEAAMRNGCQLFLQQSVTFLYGDRNGEWVDESTSITAQPEGILRSAADMEEIVNSAIRRKGLPAILLRFGSFYSHDSAHTQAMFERMRKGTDAVVGSGNVYWNLINVDDAALAVFRAVEHFPNNLGQTFNICDDKPVLYGELADEVARMLGARRPGRIPAFLARLLLGTQTVNFLLASVRCKNQLAKEKLGWVPHYSTYQEGYSVEARKWLEESGQTERS